MLLSICIYYILFYKWDDPIRTKNIRSGSKKRVMQKHREIEAEEPMLSGSQVFDSSHRKGWHRQTLQLPQKNVHIYIQKNPKVIWSNIWVRRLDHMAMKIFKLYELTDDDHVTRMNITHIICGGGAYVKGTLKCGIPFRRYSDLFIKFRYSYCLIFEVQK